jgi:predicted metalloendopeptidase
MPANPVFGLCALPAPIAARVVSCHVVSCVAAGLTMAGATWPAHALDIKGLAPEVAACSNFYAHVNSRWVAAQEIPADRARIGSFDALRIANDRLLESILIDVSAKPEALKTPGQRLAATYFASGMDELAIEVRGLKSIEPLLARIDGIVSAADLPAVIAALMRAGVAAPLAVRIAPEPKDSRRYAVLFSQSGLGLPDRDDYFKDDDRARSLMAAYRQHVRRLLDAASGKAPSADDLDELIAFESRLARASMTRVQQRDPNALYNVHSASSLAAIAPGFDWRRFIATLTARGAEPGPVEQSFVIGQVEFAKAIGDLADDAPIAVWRRYLRVRLLDTFAPLLPRAYQQSHFDYYSAAIRGLKREPTRAERVIAQISGPVGTQPLAEGLGELYVARAFSREARTRAVAMIGDIKAAMRTRIEKLDWMTPPTKARALQKLDAMAVKIGYPDKWKTYDGLTLARDDYAGNALRAEIWDFERRLADLDKPVDRTRWFTSPHIVNAFAGGLNEIVFPAGILQPPFFDPNADDAVNYGGIGTVIGHEITHHFDDRGRKFDHVGNLADWWTAEDAAAYKLRAERVAQLYSGFEPVPGERINGAQTLGENISDMAGYAIAYDGLQLALARNGQRGSKQGFSPEQRFFLSTALIWRNKMRTEALITQLRTGNHSPGEFRVLGPLANMPQFAKAFNCKAGEAMVSAAPVSVW